MTSSESFTSSSASQLSESSDIDCARPWTPITPSDNIHPQSLLENHTIASSTTTTPTTTTCSLVSRYNPVEPFVACLSPPQTPINARAALTHSLPVELPGSLLLASQGFPQTDPISPPPSLHRRDTEESSLSSLPALSISPTTHEDDMDSLRHLTYPLRRNGRGVGTGDMPTYVIRGQPLPDPLPKITKPLTAMNLEELLECLPKLDTTTVSDLWLPAVRVHLQEVTSLFHDACQIKLDTLEKEAISHDDLIALAEDVRIITDTYHKTIQSAESLMERDIAARSDRLQDLEVQVQEVSEKLECKDDKISNQDLKIRQLRQTILEIVRILGAYMEANIPDFAELAHDPEAQDVFRIFCDYTRDRDSALLRFVRIPEVTVDRYVADIKEHKSLMSEYRHILQAQSEAMQRQSADLDANVDRYASLVQRMKERDHEILLLVEKNEEVAQSLNACEAALAQSEDEKKKLAQQYQELKGKMKSLELAHTLDIDQRDGQIAELRQKLGSAREEVLARRADVRNIMSQTQKDEPSPLEMPPSSIKHSSASKALRFLGMGHDRDKFRKQGLPGSRSMIGLSPTSTEFASSPLDSRYSSKEVAPVISRPFLQRTSSHDTGRHAPRAAELSVDGPGEVSLPSHLILQPRGTSLGATERFPALRSPVDVDKTLPAPPQRSLPKSTSFARLTDPANAVYSPMADEIASNYESGIYGQAGPRRVLSRIAEVSVQGSSEAGDNHVRDDAREYDYCDAEDADSVASSDREVYRKSIHVLDLLNSSRLPYSDTENDFQDPHRQERYLQPGTANISTDSQHPDIENGMARTMQLRPQARHDNLRSSLEPVGGEGYFDRQRASTLGVTTARDSVVSVSGYRSSDSDIEPKTVAQLYHQKPRHIRT
ncbi:hypothetical protein LTR84_004511 [Exophiala bonariae]|uniref:Up-regulated during septation protein 1 domain-containing protein n=1 Tax=Exophiala bonariae TaxID=1690606 RepID=A0AAV9N9G4_9EURO|nr:hypothetical protein LTR84_004511 [Exophiala bonariae]